MSAQFRRQIELILPEARDLVNAETKRTFPVPPRPVGQSDFDYFPTVKQKLSELDHHLTDCIEILTDLNSAHEKWTSLRNNMTGAERNVDNEAYTTFIAAHPYQDTLASLKTYVRTLRNEKRNLAIILPDANQNAPGHAGQAPTPQNFAHLPKLPLPTFSGKISEFPGFLALFNATVGDTDNVPLSIKLSYLKTCLKNEPLSLIDALPLIDDSYHQAIDLLNAKYNNPVEISRSLHKSIKQMPRIRGGENFCTDLTTLIDTIESFCVQFEQQGEDPDSLPIIMEIESKLPAFMLEEIYRIRDASGFWNLNNLKSAMKTILKRKQDISALHPFKPKSTQQQQQNSGHQRQSFAPHNQQQPLNSSLAFATQNNSAPNSMPNQRQRKIPKLPCRFCIDPGHFSTHCPQYADHSARMARLRELKICFKCFGDGHFANNCPKPMICSNCQGNHPRPLCKSKGAPSTNSARQNSAGTFRSTNYTNADSNHQSAWSPATASNAIPIGCPPQNAASNSSGQTQFVPTMNFAPPPNNVQQQMPNQQDNGTVLASAPALPQPNLRQTNQVSSEMKNVGYPSSLPILLKAIKCYVFNPSNPTISTQCLILLDDCSTHSYMLASLARRLQLPLKVPTISNINVFNTPNSKESHGFNTEFGLRLLDGRSLIVNASTVDFLTCPTPYVPLDPHSLQIDYVPIHSIDTPSILIGSDHYYDLEIFPLRKLSCGYHLISTLLGPLVAGKAFCSPPAQITNYSQTLFVTNYSNFTDSVQYSSSENTQIGQLFSLENIGITEPTSEQCPINEVRQKFADTIKMVDGRYQVDLPFRSPPSTMNLPSNYGLCFGRLRSVVNSLSKNPTHLSRYHDIIQEQLNNNIIEIVENPHNFSSPLHYLAHHAVINEEKNKMRIVYDGSAHLPNLPSLNDQIDSGPPLIKNSIGLLLRFRLPKIVIISDIAKAFLQVSVNPIHRDCTRFLWLKSIAPPNVLPQNIQTFRFTRVSFGLTCSPYLLADTISHHLSKYDSLLSYEIANNIYVDNILLSASSLSEAQSKCDECIDIFSAANMPLREFASNFPEAISHLPNDFRLNSSQLKFLGIKWNTVNDEMSITIVPPQISPLTKRNVFSYFASIFDPLGYLSPLLLPIKLFIQGLWSISPSISWDDELPNDLSTKWLSIFKEWTNFSVTFPRPISSLPFDNRSFQLHAFSDASLPAFAMAIYLRVECEKSFSSTLIFAKTKVKPKLYNSNSPLTIPRLELLGALIACRALKFIQFELSSSIKIDPNIYIWTDSSIVLNWLNSPSPIKEIFVANRIKEIRQTENLIVNHIVGSMNPADLPTRGLSSPILLQNSKLWWHGPDWLSTSQTHWPINSQIKSFSSNEFKSVPPSNPSLDQNPLFTFNIQQSIQIVIIDPAKFSRLPRLIGTTVYFLRIIIRLKPNIITKLFPSFVLPKNFPSFHIKLIELRLALLFLIYNEQTRHPPPEIDNNKLGLFKDEFNILRCKGRFDNLNANPNTICPIYLPPHSPLTKLIIYETHLINHHLSPLQTLSLIRNAYWIPRGRRVVEHTLHSFCLPCRKFTSKPFELPNFPPLPSERVNPSPPFTFTGLDYLGPIHIRLSEKLCPNSAIIKKLKPNKLSTMKIWIAVFVCLSTRAIFLDLAYDMTAQNLIEIFRRFFALYSPSKIYCDNATNFQLTKRVFQILPPQFSSIEWKFRAPLAAWQGGHYERFMALIKFHLRRSLSKGIYPKLFPINSIYTCLFEITTIINSRPITFDSSNPNEPRPLCPINFLQPLRNIYPFPFPQFDSTDPDFQLKHSEPHALSLLWSKLASSSKIFWQKWKVDHLTSLRERMTKISSPANRLPIIGEMVLIYDPNLPQSIWSIGIIQELFYNQNGEPETAQLKLSDHKLKIRSIHHLYPLETVTELSHRIPNATFSREQSSNSPSNLLSHDVENKIDQPLPTINVIPPNPEKDFIQLRSRKVPRQ